MCVRLGVIILTFNEEANLAAAIDSIQGWAKEIFVVDSYSTDRTVEIALSYENRGVQVVQHAFENYSAQWNWALCHLPISQEWTLKLDADERVTPEFKDEVGQLLSSVNEEVEGFYFRRRLVFLGKRLRWGGTTQNHDLRLWRSHRATFENRTVNEHALVRGQTREIQSYVDHCDFKTFSDWLDKHNRYASMEARCHIERNVTGDVPPRLMGNPAERRMWFRSVYYKVPLRHYFYFLYRYILRLGFLDGKAGFHFAFLRASYHYWIDLKIEEYRRTGVLPEVLWPPRGQPHPVVAQSELQKLVNAQLASPVRV